MPSMELSHCRGLHALFCMLQQLALDLASLHTCRAEACECAVQKYEPPSGDLAEQIEKDFGSLDKLVAGFNPKTAAIQVHTLLPHGAVCPTPHHNTGMDAAQTET